MICESLTERLARILFSCFGDRNGEAKIKGGAAKRRLARKQKKNSRRRKKKRGRKSVQEKWTEDDRKAHRSDAREAAWLFARYIQSEVMPDNYREHRRILRVCRGFPAVHHVILCSCQQAERELDFHVKVFGGNIKQQVEEAIARSEQTRNVFQSFKEITGFMENFVHVCPFVFLMLSLKI